MAGSLRIESGTAWSVRMGRVALGAVRSVLVLLVGVVEFAAPVRRPVMRLRGCFGVVEDEDEDSVGNEMVPGVSEAMLAISRSCSMACSGRSTHSS